MASAWRVGGDPDVILIQKVAVNHEADPGNRLDAGAPRKVLLLDVSAVDFERPAYRPVCTVSAPDVGPTVFLCADRWRIDVVRMLHSAHDIGADFDDNV